MRDLSRFGQTVYDLLVIGGGINGAAIAHQAALNGLKTALLEKNDFASGTSSKSSKLMHGGIRYLEHFRFGLVREALRERSFHLQKAPHLVRPIPFLVPVYENDKRPLWLMHFGVFLYDLLAGGEHIGRSGLLTRQEILRRVPSLNPQGLRGGVLYYDAQMDDARLCLENIFEARRRGAEVANYVEVTGFLKEYGRVTGVKARDGLGNGSDFEVRAGKIFCAAGPWTNELLKMDDPRSKPRIRPTKGVHIMTSRSVSEDALLIPARRDDRVFFVLPWKKGCMIGTTDTDYAGDPDSVAAEKEDIEYLINEASRVFPGRGLRREDFSVVFAGLRPLVARGGGASRVSREHEIFETPSGLFFVTGGKYTTYRVIARDCLRSMGMSGRIKEIERVFGSGPLPRGQEAEELAAEWDISADILNGLIRTYGSRYQDVLHLTHAEKRLKERVVPDLPYIRAQFSYSRQSEMAQTPADILMRRLGIAYSPRDLERGGALLEQAADEVFRKKI